MELQLLAHLTHLRETALTLEDAGDNFRHLAAATALFWMLVTTVGASLV